MLIRYRSLFLKKSLGFLHLLQVIDLTLINNFVICDAVMEACTEACHTILYIKNECVHRKTD
jgi:hypothetical protein